MNEQEIMNIMEKIKYGWLDKNNKVHHEVDNNFSDSYVLQSPTQVLENKIGVCWDQVELERYLFKETSLEITTYFIVHYDNNKCPTHTFLVYNKDNKVYWFEHSWNKYKGIHEYNNLIELIIEDPSFKMSKEEILSIMDPKNFVGRAPEQVVEFINETLDPAINEYKDIIGNLNVDLHV